MNNQIQIFNNPQFGDIRTAKTDTGEPIFCLSDICKAVSLTNPTSVANRLDDDEIIKCDLGRENQVVGNSIANYITESGFYNVILFSSSPNVKPFRKWVTSEVLPSIRKNGGYITTKPEDTPEIIMARAVLVADAAIKALEAKNALLESCNQDNVKKLAEQAPKVLFADSVATSDKSILVGELAKIICQNGYKIGQNRLYVYLRSNGYLGRLGEFYNIPSQKSIELGLFEIKKTTINKPDGTILVSTTSKVTSKGQIYFINKFLAATREGVAK